MNTYRVGNGLFLTLGDATAWLRTFAAASADLVFTDPPFNIGYQYDEYADNRPQAEYLAWCRQWMAAAASALYAGGAFWLAISDENAAELCVMAKAMGFTLRNWCIWRYNFGPHLKTKFGRNKAHLLYFTKGRGKPAFFDPSKIMEPSLRQTKYKDKRAAAGGRVPGDVWEFSRLCGTFKERTGHPCQMPEKILERILLATCPPCGKVLDPFAGSGVTLAAGRTTGRNVFACELSAAYVRGAIKRLTTQPTPTKGSDGKAKTK